MRVIPDVPIAAFAFGIEINLSGTPAMDKLWEYISKSKEEDKIHKNLAGNISRSLHLDDTDNWFLDNVLISLIENYKGTFKESSSHASQVIFNKNVPYAISTLWVNHQKQHEFNPLHKHSGLFSFNIFMKIPYNYKEQHEIPFVKNSNSPKAGNFEFVYSDSMGNIHPHTYDLDSSSEGLMLFFPAEMYHQVYPFYNCEEERITISGNIVYDI